MSLEQTIDKAPTSIRKSIQGKVFAVPGLSFHPTKFTEKRSERLQEDRYMARSGEQFSIFA